ncbi:hypothetical protein LEN26_013477 [Aphanomyces euteiches]|nr:hypothetical protein LEN26_013477 [Aphanomyces euteiches]KAH9128636.1 hypothetical protein AeMF1_001219 [Aphanomyces euteiches]KAH9188835.1 hypothetical protein AeNC1_009185 [Aphanomyces euteiches]
MADTLLCAPELLTLITSYQHGVWEGLHKELQDWKALFKQTDHKELWRSFQLAPAYGLHSLKDPRFVLHHAIATHHPVDFICRVMQQYPSRISTAFFELASRHLPLADFALVYKEALALGVDVPGDHRAPLQVL